MFQDYRVSLRSEIAQIEKAEHEKQELIERTRLEMSLLNLHKETLMAELDYPNELERIRNRNRNKARHVNENLSRRSHRKRGLFSRIVEKLRGKNGG